MTTIETTWEPCAACGAVTRHDNGRCYRDPASPIYHPSTKPHGHGPLRDRLELQGIALAAGALLAEDADRVVALQRALRTAAGAMADARRALLCVRSAPGPYRAEVDALEAAQHEVRVALSLERGEA